MSGYNFPIILLRGQEGAGYDFKTEPEPEHAFVILTFTSTV